MDCNRCGSCCRESYIAFMASHVSELLEKYHLDRMPGTFSDYGYEIVYWGNCPFLSSSSECSIYDDRPIECRTFPVITWSDGRLKITTECDLYQTVTRKDVALARRENAMLKALLIKGKNSFERSGGDVLKQARRFLADLAAWEKATSSVPCFYIDAMDATGQRR